MDTQEPTRPAGENGFTRLDLCGVLAAIAFLAMVTLPALAGGRLRSDRVICANNLRQVGTAFLLWGNEHDDQVPFEVSVAEGGTRQHPLAPNAWLHFSWLSNELRSPKVLLCPSDTGQPARDFTGDPSGGYLHPNFANRATSYFLSHWFNPSSAAALAGDRNILRESGSSCSRFVTVVRASAVPLRGDFGWLSGLHENQGNLLRFDGRVEQLNNPGFRQALDQADADNGSLHFLLPR